VYRSQPTVQVNHGSTFLVAHPDGGIPSAVAEYGLYAYDTRFLSGYERRLTGRRPQPLAFSRLSFHHARWHLVAEDVAGAGGWIAGARVAITLDRMVGSHHRPEDLVCRTSAADPLA